MARNGTTYLYSATPGAGQGTALQAALAGNLGQWTVSSLVTIGAGATERNYIVLTNGTAEILCYAPNGSSSTIATGIYAPYISDLLASTTIYPILFGLAPTGGFTVAIASFDPVNQDFWDDIVITQSKVQPGPMHPIAYWTNGTGAQDIWFIEDDARAFLCIHSRRQSNPSQISCHVIADDAVDNSYITTPANQIKTYGHFANQVALSGTPPDLSAMRWSLWNQASTPILISVASQTALNNMNIFNGVPSAAIPLITGEVPTGKIPLFAPGAESSGSALDELLGTFNPIDLRFISTNFANFKQKVGTDANGKFLYSQKGILVPWDESETVPS